uniref:Protein kinase n=1 Tax=Cryptomeria japonica TaxID=3369 RepID=A0A1V1G0S6_CRYJA|nr:protein kinase [Cryptomeria japonica]
MLMIVLVNLYYIIFIIVRSALKFLLVISFITLQAITKKSVTNQEGTTSTYNTSQTNGTAERGGTQELHVDLLSEQIYTNLTADQISYIKSICHESHQIGEGIFARVYRGNFQGEDLIIKKIEHRSHDTKQWVKNEVELLQGKEHINVNKLYGWYVETNLSYLAYIHIDGCTLDDYLRGNCRGFTYNWKQSFKMIMGIAKGIEFLHQNKIIHVHINPQNILVDAKDHEAKLIDFGFSRHVDWKGEQRSIEKIIDTKGSYRSPEYCLIGKLSYKHDVYSFGIIVLEMIIRRRHDDGARKLFEFHTYVTQMIENNCFEEIVQDGWDSFAVKEALAVANIALTCAHPDETKRPDMDLVVRELSSMITFG